MSMSYIRASTMNTQRSIRSHNPPEFTNLSFFLKKKSWRCAVKKRASLVPGPTHTASARLFTCTHPPARHRTRIPERVPSFLLVLALLVHGVPRVALGTCTRLRLYPPPTSHFPDSTRLQSSQVGALPNPHLFVCGWLGFAPPLSKDSHV